jgi:OOP family OmpA-OmpF porin
VPSPVRRPLVRRPLVIWLLAALAVPVLLTAILIPARAGTTEDDLHDRTVAALQARGIETGSIDFDGRDAKVVVPDGVDAELVRQVVGSVDGVRTVRIDAATTSPSAAPPAEPAVPSFEVGRTDQSIRVQGAVKDQGVQDAIAAEVAKVLGDDREYDDRTTIDANGLPDATAVSSLLSAIAVGTGDASVRWDGSTVTLSGEVPDQATKATIARAAAKAVPGAVIANQLEVPPPPAAQVSEACRTFPTRLSEFTRQHKINFLSGTAIVNDASKPTVVKAAALLKTCPAAFIEVAGHTDNLGSPASSLPLSERRAAEVKAELVKLGVAATHIHATGYGQAFPIASNSTADGRIENRRAEIRVLQGN